MFNKLKVKVINNNSVNFKKKVLKGLNAHNFSYAGPYKWIPMNIEAIGKNGVTCGGLAGMTLWGWLHIKLLWVVGQMNPDSLPLAAC